MNKKRKDYLKWNFNEVVERFDFVESIQKETRSYKKNERIEVKRNERFDRQRKVELFKTDCLPSELLQRLENELPPPITGPFSQLKKDLLKRSSQLKKQQNGAGDRRGIEKFTEKLNTFISSVDHIYDLEEGEKAFLLPEYSKRKFYKSKYVSQAGSFSKISVKRKESNQEIHS